MSNAGLDSAYDVAAVRQDFPILDKPLPGGMPLVYLDNGATVQKPRSVIEKLVECYENYNANVHRGIHSLGDQVTTELEAAREKVRALLGADEVEEILFTSGTTMSINLVANAWGRKFLRAGDELLLNEMEHHANLVPWQQIAHERGAKLRFIPLTADGRLDLTALDDVLTDRTKLVAVTAMSNVLGTINPIGEIAARAHARGALVLVDAAQSVPHGLVNVNDPRVDFFAFSGHKVYGPTGIGVLYGRRKILEAMDPFLCGGNMIRRVRKESSDFAELPSKFEAGTIPIAQAIGLGAAIDYVQGLGFEAIAAHEHQLTARAFDQLQQIPGLQIVGPGLAHRGSIVSFTVEGVHPHDMAELLDRKGVAVRAGHHCTMPLHEWLGVTATTRASFALYNTHAEIDALCEAIQYARQVFRRK
ncbi:MAG: cysteine desulfurase [Planctomycetaceae bacterium]|nr:cysteine desulfurase [Planctomycetaceae bacterium]